MLILLVAMTAGVVLGLWVDVPVWCAIVCLIAFYIVSFGRRTTAELTLLVAFAMAGVHATNSTHETINFPNTLFIRKFISCYSRFLLILYSGKAHALLRQITNIVIYCAQTDKNLIFFTAMPQCIRLGHLEQGT